MGKTCTCNQEKPKIKTGLCEPNVPTHQMRDSNGAERAGKDLRAKTQNFPCRWENHEWMTTAQARQITREKFRLTAWTVRNFSPLLSRTKNTIFVSLTAYSQRKLLLIYLADQGWNTNVHEQLKTTPWTTLWNTLTFCFSDGSCWEVIIHTDPGRNVVAQTICCWWMCGFAWWPWHLSFCC